MCVCRSLKYELTSVFVVRNRTTENREDDNEVGTVEFPIVWNAVVHDWSHPGRFQKRPRSLAIVVLTILVLVVVGTKGETCKSHQPLNHAARATLEGSL